MVSGSHEVRVEVQLDGMYDELGNRIGFVYVHKREKLDIIVKDASSNVSGKDIDHEELQGERDRLVDMDSLVTSLSGRSQVECGGEEDDVEKSMPEQKEDIFLGPVEVKPNGIDTQGLKKK